MLLGQPMAVSKQLTSAGPYTSFLREILSNVPVFLLFSQISKDANFYHFSKLILNWTVTKVMWWNRSMD